MNIHFQIVAAPAALETHSLRDLLYPLTLFHDKGNTRDTMMDNTASVRDLLRRSKQTVK